MASNKKADPPTVDERWIYVGRRISGDSDTPSLRWAYINEDTEKPTINDEHWFSSPLGTKSKRSNDILGCVYTIKVEHKEGGGITAHGKAQWEGQSHRSTQEQMNWQAQDEEAQAIMAQHRRKKEARARDPILEALKPVRTAMWKTNAAGRRALLAKILEYLGRGAL